MKIEDKVFYFLETSDFGDYLLETKREAVKKLIEIAKDEKILSGTSEDELKKLKIHRIDASKDKWKIKELEWSEIAVEILEELA